MARKKTIFCNPLTETLGEDFFATIPKCPGVYFMRTLQGEILYVGKATDLRSRVSSYRSAKPGKVGRNIVKLVQRIEHITWEVHESEEKAYQRERQIIRAIVPRYNIEDAWEEEYFFIGIRHNKRGELEFRLTSSEEDQNERFDLHGCYPQRRSVKQAYASLLRLLYAASRETGSRFSFPAKLARPSPAYRYTLKLAQSLKWKNLVSAFLHGQDAKFLPHLVEALLSNDVIPEYSRPALQRDLETLRVFDEACLASRRALDLQAGEVMSHADLRRAIRESLPT
ncbi:MAG: GIY-YIG nuclease family protein [Bdellovibrionota bacterium]